MFEAFVYCWTDFLTNKLYVGVHKGSPDDGYICSSKVMLQEHKKRPQDFSRQIIAFGLFNEMYVLETAILKAAKADKNPRFYNSTNNQGPFYHTGPQTPEHLAKRVAAATGRKRGPQSPEHRAKTSAIHKGKRKPESMRERLRGNQNAKGTKHTEEYKKLHTLYQMGIQKPRVLCPNCGTSGGKPVMSRYHFNNCKKVNVS